MRAIWTRLALGIATLALALASGAANAVCDVMTGGGFIIVDGAQANFGVAGGCKDGSPTFGHLEYIDHGADLKVHWISITGYNEEFTTTDSRGRRAGSRFICGTARTNLFGDVNFIVRARDAGEPGDMDEFDITLLATPYSTLSSGFHQLSGGNIQLHGPTAGDFDPTCTIGA